LSARGLTITGSEPSSTTARAHRTRHLLRRATLERSGHHRRGEALFRATLTHQRVLDSRLRQLFGLHRTNQRL
jgi:hypothetical protein